MEIGPSHGWVGIDSCGQVDQVCPLGRFVPAHQLITQLGVIGLPEARVRPRKFAGFRPATPRARP
jgi:hypothetical protein